MTPELAIEKLVPVQIVHREATPRTLEPQLFEQTTRMRGGHDDAWQWFHSHYYFALLRYAATRSRNADDAVEIVQLTYLRVARHIRPFSDDGNFRAWLACIIRCTAIDHARSVTRRNALIEKFAHWRELRSNHDIPASADQLTALADDALAELDDDDARLLRLKYYEGWSTQELADDMATTAKAIEHRLARLRDKLRDIILQIQ